MPLLQMLATAQEEESLGHLQDLTSPVLGKLKEALIFTRLANAQRRAFGSRTVVLEGLHGAQLHVGWFEEARLLIMAYKNINCNAMDEAAQRAFKHFIPVVQTNDNMVSPEWLRKIAPDAAVHSGIFNIFESFKDGDQCLAAVMKSITGGITPRRITNVGYCVGGSVASLAAVFSAMQCPTADVRCITFGSQLVGNAAFAETFRWLVGLSYRVVYRRDPIPSAKQRKLLPINNGYVHVHGEIYIDDEQLKPGKQPTGFEKDPDDHSLMRYAEAMHAICLAHFERDRAAGGNLYAKFAKCYLQLAGVTPKPKQGDTEAPTHDKDTSAGDQPHEGPFDFKSPVQKGRPEVPSDNGYAAPHNGDFTEEEKERGRRCGRALLERAMLGPPLQETEMGVKGSSGDAEAISAEAVKHSEAINDANLALQSISQDPDHSRQALLSAIKADLETDDQPEARRSTAKPTAVPLHNSSRPAEPELGLPVNVNAVNSGSWFPRREQDPNHGVLMSLLEEDMQSDNKQSIRAGTLEQTARQPAPLSQSSLQASSQQGPQTVAESISPRYSSQQSQGTNIDWDSDAAEVSSSHRRSASLSKQQQRAIVAPNATASPGDVPSAAQSALAANDGVQAAASNQEQLPANAVAPPRTVADRVSMSKSGQQASAMQADVQGMAPNPGAIMIGEEGGGRPWLKRAFSMVDQENMNMGIDMNSQMDSLDKVLVTGKISQAVVVAAAAYRNEAAFRERTGIEKTKLIIDDFHTNTHVHVGWLEGGTAILAFRGTQTAQDGLQDVKIVRQSIDHLQGMFPGTQAHSGFLQQFAGVCRPDEPEKNMATVIEQLSGGRSPTRVLCCGHSLGGALATLGATWAALQYPQADIRCITFGSPRVGNKAFKRAFHTLVGTSLRLVHGGDPVPVLPPAFVYHHVNGAIHIRGGKIKLRSRPWHFKLRPNVADHLVARYNAGIFLHMPGGLEAMPLPRPRNMRRLNSLATSSIAGDTSTKGGAVSKVSQGRSLDNVLPTEAEEELAQVGGPSAYGAYGAVYNKANDAVQEARGVTDALHLTKPKSDGLIGRSFRKLKRDSSGSDHSSSGGWTMWHMFGCVAMQKGVKDESSSSDEDESIHAVPSRHSRSSRVN